MRNIPHLTPTAWTSEQQAAFDGLISAWIHDDDLRRSRTATLEQRHQALLELETARRALRHHRHGRPTLAA